MHGDKDRRQMRRKVMQFFTGTNPCPDYPHNCDICPHMPYCYIYRQPLPATLQPPKGG